MALDADLVWECRSAGNNDNGGAFDPTVASPGTDYSKQDAAQLTFTDLYMDDFTNTDVQSSAFPLSATHVGNVINITSGTGWTTGRYVIVSYAGGFARLDRSPAAVSTTGGNGKLGGAYADPSILATLILHGQKVWLKGSWSITSASSGVAGGRILNTVDSATWTQLTNWEGYTTTRGDGGFATLTVSGVNTFYVVSSTGRGCVFRNIHVIGTGRTGIGGFSSSVYNCYYWNCKVTDNQDYAFNVLGLRSGCFFCFATGGSYHHFRGNHFWWCYSKNAGQHAFVGYDEGTTYGCIANNPSWQAFHADNGQIQYVNCTAYSAGNNGYRCYDTPYHCTYINCIAYGNAEYGFKNQGSGRYETMQLVNCAGGSNTSGNKLTVDADYDSGFITLSADPFNNAAGDDFSLNNTAGGGALLRDLAWPATLHNSNANKFDIGGVQMGLTTADIAAIVDAIWDEDATAHQTGGTFGQAIGDPALDSNSIFKAVVTDAAGATVGVDVVAIQADADNIQTRLPTALVSGRIDASVGAMASGVVTAAAVADGAIDAATFATGAITAAAIAADAIGASELAADAVTEIANGILDLANGIETSVTLRQALRAIAGALVGETSGMGTTSGTVKAAGNAATTRVTATLDADGNRSAVSLSL